jgi:hypothetical protein
VKLHLASEILWLIITIALFVDTLRLRLQRYRGCETCARLAGDALADSTMVDGVRMPEPNALWRRAATEFVINGKPVKGHTLELGDVRVDEATAQIFFGLDTHGATTPAAIAYGKRVIVAHRQRIVDQSVKNG